MGHAVNGTLQDVWARYRRMTGYEVLWLPGTDHAAISTQNVIEKQLAKDGTTKEEIGRGRLRRDRRGVVPHHGGRRSSASSGSWARHWT